MKKKQIVFEFLRYSDIEKLESADRIKKVLAIVKSNKIILMEGRFRKEEEAQLIQKTMESIDNKFKGIEIAVINPNSSDGFLSKIKEALASFLLGDRDGLTLIGPASVIHEIKQNPHKLNQLSLDLS